jgi:MerR family transcriptional regulator, heat shock protein HspR
MDINDVMDPRFTIGNVAKLLGVSVATLRLYDRRGLLVVEKSCGNQRVYSKADVQRLQCIRTAINEHKISIEGIRRIHSMIPCWEHVQCSAEQKLGCPAYNSPEAGCWTYKHEHNACAERACRDCKVYQLSSDCENIKRLVHNMAMPDSALITKSTRDNEP